jgi:uncharacterized protein (DUF4415 family)
MKGKKALGDEPVGKLTVVKDFLPRPEELVRKQDAVKVTLNLNRASVEFFKKVGKTHQTPYQKVIRNLLDYYATHMAV